MNIFSSRRPFRASGFCRLWNALGLVAPPAWSQDVISVIFHSTDNGGSTAINSAETAGLIPVSNWNNSLGATQTTPQVVNFSTGGVTGRASSTASGATITWSSDNTWSDGNDSDGNHKLFHGYLDDNDGRNGNIPANNAQCTVTNIPFAVYDVYVYSHGDAGDGSKQGKYWVDNASVVHSFADGSTNFQFCQNDHTFVPALSDGTGTTAGNTLKFSGLTFPNITITTDPNGRNGQRAPLDGFQIVELTPKITSMTPSGGLLAGGDQIQVAGINFAPGASFTFDAAGTPAVAPAASFINSTLYVVTTPPHAAGSVTLTYTNGAISSPAFPGFLYTNNAVPTINGVAPLTGSPVGGYPIQISGTNFRAGAKVTIGKASLDIAPQSFTDPDPHVVINSNSLITLQVPPTIPAGALGLVDVIVTNSDTTNATSLNAFTYTLGVNPTVDHVFLTGTTVQATAPSTAVSTTVDILGSNFGTNLLNATNTDNTNSIIFTNNASQSIALTSATVVSVTPSKIVCTLPILPANFIASGAGVFNVKVTNPDTTFGSLTDNSAFVYIGLVVNAPNAQSSVGFSTGQGVPAGTTNRNVIYFNSTSQLVTLTPNTIDDGGAPSNIFYTTDGTDPAFDPNFGFPLGTTQVYSVPFAVTNATISTTVKTIAGISGITGPEQTVVYVPYFAPQVAVPLTLGSLNVEYFDEPAGSQIPSVPWVPSTTNTQNGLATAVAPDILTQFAGSATPAPGTTPLRAGENPFGVLLNGRPAPYDANPFFARIKGIIVIPTDGIYSFATGTDDGSFLFIDGNDLNHEVVANNNGQGVTRRFGQIGLQAGQHTIEIDYSNSGGGFGIEVVWDTAGGTNVGNFVDIPNANLGFPLSTITWLGAAGSTWNNPANWVDNLGANRIPQYLDAVVLTGNGSPPTTLDIPNLTITSLTYDGTTAQDFAIVDSTGTGLRFSGSPDRTGAATSKVSNTSTINPLIPQTINANLVVLSPVGVNLNPTGTLTVNGTITGAGGLNIVGPGTVNLTNLGSYTGITTIANATVNVTHGIADSNGGLGTGILSLTSSTVNVLAASTTARNVTLVNTNNVINLTTGSNTTMTGVFTGTGGFTKSGTAKLTLSADSRYSGGTTVTGGIVEAAFHPGGTDPFGTGTITLTGGNLLLDGAHDLVGLTVNLYNVNPANDGGTPNRNPNYVDLPTITAHFAGMTPGLIVQSNANGVPNFDFSNANYGNGAPFANLGFAPTDNIEAYMTGKFVATQAGDYTFATTSDDGSMLFIDGATVVSNNAFQGATRHTGTVTLTAGPHDIIVAFYEGGGGAGLLVEVTPPGGQNRTLTNSDVVTPTPNQLNQAYGNNLAINANATISVNTAPNVTFGTLTMGNNVANTTLFLTGDPNLVLNLGSGSLNGDATFDVPASDLINVGGLTGTTQKVTKQNSGNMYMAGQSTYTGQTTIADDGTLRYQRHYITEFQRPDHLGWNV